MSEEAFVRCGKINAAASDSGVKHNETYARHLAAMGEPCEVLDVKAMQDLTGIDFYRNGVFTPGAAMVQPALFMRAMASGLSGKADLFEQSPVTALERQGGGWCAETPKGSVTAPRGSGRQRSRGELRLLQASPDARLHLCLDDPRVNR